MDTTTGLASASALKAILANLSIVQEYMTFETSRASKVAAIRPVMATLGIAGSILILITLFKNKGFHEPCFICYKAIAMLSILYGVCEIISPMYRISDFYYLPLRTYFITDYTWSWLRYVGNQALFMFAEDSAVCLVVFLTLQRAAACLLPIKFRSLDDRWMCLLATIFSIVFTFAYSLPAVFWEDVKLQSGRYALWRSETTAYRTYLTARNVIRFILVPAVFVSSALAILGLLKVFIKRYGLDLGTRAVSCV